MYLIIQFRKNHLASLHESKVLVNKLIESGVNNTDINIINFLGSDITTKTVQHMLAPNSKVVLGGSGDVQMWDISKELLTKLANLITFLLNKEIPSLGICVGHQVLGKVIGAELKHHGEYEELGFTQIYLTQNGKTIYCLQVYQPHFGVQLAIIPQL